jgi:hypothetical protein
VKKLLVVLVIVAAAGAVGGWVLYDRLEDDPDETAAPVTWNTCTNRVQGFSIDYPAGWHTDHPAPELACFYFDPRRFEVPEASDFAGTALEVHLDDDFEQALDSWTDERFVKVLDREELDLDGRRAELIHTETTSGAEFEPGTQTYLYVVEREPGAVLVRTTSTAGIDYTPWKRIVDRAVRTLRFSQRGQRQIEGSNVIPPQAGLPTPVARKRAEIWNAARGGDYGEVARLVDPKGFEYTFGGAVPGGPAAYWRKIDQTTDERPIETLVAILELPYAYQAESKLYVWPDAFTRKAPTLSQEEKDQLAEAIGDESLKLYEQLGDYLGYRAGIDKDGNWVFYVAGD